MKYKIDKKHKDYSIYSERQLKKMLDEKEKKEAKLGLEFNRLKLKLETLIQQKHFIKDAIMEKWRQPSENLLKAIDEIKNGKTTTYKSVEEMMKDLK